MTWRVLEQAFNRALALSFSRSKLFLAFPALAISGLLVVFCRALALGAGDWMAMSLAFLPILASSGLLLALGVLIARIHYHEVKGLSLHLRRLLSGSLDIVIGTSYLSIPPLLIYFLLWLIMGFFFLLKEIPWVGDVFSVVFSFGPFLLIFGSFVLCFFNLLLLFFVAPAAALHAIRHGSLAKKIALMLKTRLLSACLCFIIALIPLALVGGLLIASAMITNFSFPLAEKSLFQALQWFFIMLPFSLLLTPAVVFFFNFAAESHLMLEMEVRL